MRSLSDTLQEFPEARDRGLSAAEVSASLERYGVNRLSPLPREPLWRKFLAKFDEAIIKILLAATLLKTAVDLFGASAFWGVACLAAVIVVLGLLAALGRQHWLPAAMFALAVALAGVSVGIGHPSWEGLAVMLAVVLATGVAFLSEYKSDREFEILNAQKESVRVKVMRDGEVTTVPLEEVVVGEQVVLDTGDEVPADGRLVSAGSLTIDQSLLTGESIPAEKLRCPLDDTTQGPDHTGCVYRGTQVVDGVGRMLVTEVGDLTMLGQIARRLSAEDAPPEVADAAGGRVQRKLHLSREQTPLQEKLTALAGFISRLGYFAAAAIFVALLARGLVVGEVTFSTDPDSVRRSVANLLDYFVYMVIIIVVAVPEGLPMSVTISLALAMRKMTRANSLVRQLVACETIGSATIICSDKTGTLTQNKMSVERLFWEGRTFRRGGDWPAGVEPPSGTLTPIQAIVLNCALNSSANLEHKGGRTVVVGNTTEGALLQWLVEVGASPEALRRDCPALMRWHFSSERKRMTTVAEHQGVALALVKGAPEVVVEECNRYLADDGRILDLDAVAREKIAAAMHDAAAEAMRTLAFAYRPVRDEELRQSLGERRLEFERDLIFAGLAAIRDPLRGDVKAAVQECRDAGIEVMMITGDNVETALAIGREIGLLARPDSLVLTSAEFNELSDDQVREYADRIRILARAKPLDKYRMVRLLQEKQHVVAVTGDGTNDAPALKKADVGLAMGLTGTEVAKEASKIVLLDDSFATIVKAVHWGRALYENIQRFIQFQLTINVSALVIAFLGPFLGVKPPFTVLQLLWINVIMDTFAAIALCSEPPRSGIMRQRPKRRDEAIVTPDMRRTILATAAFFVVNMLLLLIGMQHFRWFRGEESPSHDFPEFTMRQVTIFFTVYVFFQLWNQINCRSLAPDRSGWRRLYANPAFLGIVTVTVVVQVLLVTFGGQVFQVEPLSVLDWLVIAAATSPVLLFATLDRMARRRRAALS